MKILKIADQIVSHMYKSFLETGTETTSAESLLLLFPDESRSSVFSAIRILAADKLLSVSYANNEPNDVAINVSAIRQCDENTILKKGYNFLKEIRSWL